MGKLLSTILAVLGIVSLISVIAVGNVARAAAPAEAQVQGLYEGTGSDASGQFKIEARVVAQGNGNYNVFVRQLRDKDKIARAALQGKTQGDDVILSGKAGDVEWQGKYADGAINGRLGSDGKFQVLRVERRSPTLGKKPPQGAIVLLDGKDFSQMTRQNGAKWEPDKASVGPDGSIQVPAGGMTTKRAFDGNIEIHVEFLIPFMPAQHSQGRGNSGMFLPNSDEIQVLDSFGETTYLGGGCGGIYPYKDPDVMETIESLKGKPECKFTLASLPPLAWQTYDVEYRVSRQGGKPRLTVYHNGVKIHDNVEIRGADIGYAPKGKLHFQDHGNPVRYRNIWVLPVD